MKFSARTNYAFRASLALARQRQSGKEVLTLHELSDSCDIPLKFLVAVLANLRRGNIVESIRGKDGGYRLAKEPENVRVGDILRATESKGSGSLRSSADRPEKAFFENLRRKAEAGSFAIFDAVTLKDAIEAVYSSTGSMYYI